MIGAPKKNRWTLPSITLSDSRLRLTICMERIN